MKIRIDKPFVWDFLIIFLALLLLNQLFSRLNAQTPGEEVWFVFHKYEGEGRFSEPLPDEPAVAAWIKGAREVSSIEFYRNAENQITGIHKGTWGQYVAVEQPVTGLEFVFTPLDDQHIMIFYSKDGESQVPRVFQTEEAAEAFRLEIDEDDSLALTLDLPFLGTRGTITEQSTSDIKIIYDITP